ncbi:hypothetical protein QE152_g27217 [Popillia japonica]|uniref:Uncharacterized protein n=1 Tax=Popillia japonica TaxID=7064 RepID=A0AAW1JVH2_POPJA
MPPLKRRSASGWSIKRKYLPLCYCLPFDGGGNGGWESSSETSFPYYVANALSRFVSKTPNQNLNALGDIELSRAALQKPWAITGEDDQG